MKTFKFIIKGILLYITTFFTLLYITGIDSIMDNGLFLEWTSVIVIAIVICYFTINKEEFEILSFSHLIKEEEEEL